MIEEAVAHYLWQRHPRDGKLITEHPGFRVLDAGELDGVRRVGFHLDDWPDNKWIVFGVTEAGAERLKENLVVDFSEREIRNLLVRLILF